MSRAYIPETLWPELKQIYISELATVKIGYPRDFSNFMNAVIDKKAYNSITKYIEFAKNSSEAEITSGGNYDNAIGYFIEPTTIITNNHDFKTMKEEIFGPILIIYLYDQNKCIDTLKIFDETSTYAMTV